ncbi:receptor-like protein EIX2 [Cornus florida]|uniref:receptor-like protein EIX2 n=1 Tax=Cornus florida TaxID=4283 RepID=UPI00289D375E|nr:receptor-like protein EIX2 [Cornus florida]
MKIELKKMMMMMMSSRIALVTLWLLSFSTALLLLCDGTSHVVCSEKEKTALLNFKQGISWDPSNRLSSWSGLQQDCCTWTGVRCNNVTGRVIQLHLSNPYNHFDDYESYETQLLGGKISSSLVELESLIYLDLSMNNFSGSTIPSFFGSMPSLRYLNLSYAYFEGLIPHQLGNLSGLRVLDLKTDNDQLYVDDLSWTAGLHSLEYVDMSWIDLGKAVDWHRQLSNLPSLSELRLSGCNLQGPISHQLANLSSLRHLNLGFNFVLYADDLSWIARLRSLEYLLMSGADLHKAVDWLQSVSMLPYLSELHLPSCQLEKMIPPLSYVNFTSLKFIELGYNNLNCKIPDLLFNFTSNLQSLDLSGNSLYGQIASIITGEIPDGLGQLKHLEYLSLAVNSLYGPIPASIGNLSSLRFLDLSDNKLSDTFPKSMGFLSNLEELWVGYNSLGGIVSEVNFAKLSKLKILYMSSNSLFFNVNSNWVPPFQLEMLSMRSCKMGPSFPSWLQTQVSLYLLDISQSGISGAAPEWLWKWVSGIDFIHLSNNQINGDISNVSLNSIFVDISSNRFEGSLPRLSPNVRYLNLANNSFFGPISSFLCQEMNGESMLKVLDVSNNILLGELSHCLMHWQHLTHVNVGSNHLSGKIPNSLGSLRFLESLQLYDNNFFGEIPLSIRNCTYLRLINLGGNKFTGFIPSWIGDILDLKVLSLRSNKFISNIPSQICQLSGLIILDLGNNSLSGPIPKCLKNISALTIANSTHYDIFAVNVESLNNIQLGVYMDILSLVTKGRESEYKEILRLVTSIDLSHNNLSGSIPDDFFSLDALRFLNLSHNKITGKIPENIGGMKLLESLDISRNYLLGEIPQSMSNLTFLSYLNLSYNFLNGRIPTGTQLQSFDATSYIGNAELCGAPLNNCTREEESQGRGVSSMEEEEEEHEMVWFYIGMGPGFVVGFWIVCGTLLLKRTWRHAYFQLLDDMKDRIYVAILIKVNWFRNKFKRSNET